MAMQSVDFMTPCLIAIDACAARGGMNESSDDENRRNGYIEICFLPIGFSTGSVNQRNSRKEGLDEVGTMESVFTPFSRLPLTGTLLGASRVRETNKVLGRNPTHVDVTVGTR